MLTLFGTINFAMDIMAGAGPAFNIASFFAFVVFSILGVSIYHRSKPLIQHSLGEAAPRTDRVTHATQKLAQRVSAARAGEMLADHALRDSSDEGDDHEAVGTAMRAAATSFCFFASGAIIPIIPFLFGVSGIAALVIAAVLVGVALLATGAVVGILSGGPPLKRALRQLAIGYGAAAATYLLGLAFGTVVG